jgi:excisionase family DNA binding protein
MAQLSTSFKPQLIKVAEAAELLNVSTSTVHNWIRTGAIPYIELPKTDERQRTDYRIPLKCLVASLSGNYDLSADLAELADAAQQQGVDADALITAADGAPPGDDE